MTKAAVVLLSGGLDSTTVAYMAKKDVGKTGKIFPLAFLYGQNHAYELIKARQTAEKLGSELCIVAVGLNSICQSALTSGAQAVPVHSDSNDIPATWVPQRNAIFLAMAYAYAETVGADRVYIGVNVVDYSGYPDCRPEFIQAMEKALNLASKQFVTEGKGIGLIAPLLKLKKTEIIETGRSLGVDYADTWSCYRGPSLKNEACGVCDSCAIRLQAFETIGVPDPLKYEGRT